MSRPRAGEEEAEVTATARALLERNRSGSGKRLIQDHAEPTGVKSMIEFKLEAREYIELKDLLKVTGLFASGGMAKTAISEGRVTIDGRPELRRRCKVRRGHVVGLEGRTVAVT